MSQAQILEQRGPYPVYAAQFWPRYWIHMRPYLLFISGIAAFAGMALVDDPPTGRTIAAGVLFFFSYGLGQALTDVFQTDTDAISSEYRPLVRGEIRKAAVLSVSLLGFALMSVLFALWNPRVLPIGIACALGLVLYTPLKRTWWGGPPWNSWIVALLPVMGYLIVGGVWAGAGWKLGTVGAAVFFGYANFVVSGYFKDISADRATGYHTFPVRFGWRAAAVYSDVLAVLAVICTGLAIAPAVASGSFRGWMAAGVLAVAAVLNARAQIALHRTRDEHDVHRPIAAVVRCFLLYCSAIVVAHQPSWAPYLPLYLVLFESSLRSRPEPAQV
jgi:4-hydroxybenzoate polyprenyltransferase